MLAANAVLRHLELQNNRINDVGMQALAAGVAKNTALFTLKTETRSARRPSTIFLAALSDTSEAARASIAAKCLVACVLFSIECLRQLFSRALRLVYTRADE